jgi:hypothetical protein
MACPESNFWWQTWDIGFCLYEIWRGLIRGHMHTWFTLKWS